MHEKDLLIKIGNNITSIRKQQGISSKELGYRCKIEKSKFIAVRKIELSHLNGIVVAGKGISTWSWHGVWGLPNMST